MIKKSIACAGFMLLAIPAAQADNLGVYGAIQGWFPSVDAAYGSQDSVTSYNFDRADTLTGYIAFEHPIPAIPNVKLRYSDYGTEGTSNSAIDVASMEFTLYYEVIDFDLTSLDLGVTLRQLDGDFKSDAFNESLNLYLPTLYAAVSTELPFTGVSFFADLNYVGYNGSDVTDWQVGVGYKLIDNLAVDLTLQLGYRSTHLELNDVDDIYGEFDYDGVFAGLEAHF